MAAITVYTMPKCTYCDATKALIDRADAKAGGAIAPHVTYVDMSQDAEALAWVKSQGHRQAPVVVAGEEVWSGLRPDKLRPALRDLSASAVMAHAA